MRMKVENLVNPLNGLAKKFELRSFIIGLVIGGLTAGYSVFNHLESRYVRVHDSNIGGFVFKNGKVYNLSELKNL